MAASSKGHIPQAVIWGQTSILREISRLIGALTALTNLTANPTSDTRGVVTRNIRDQELIESLIAIPEVLERIQQQLSFLTNVPLKKGDTVS